MSVIDELVTILGVDLDAAALAKVDALKSGMEKLEKWSVKATIAVTAATTTFAYWLKTIGKNSEGLVRLADMTGVSTNEIQGLSYAVEQLGGSSEALKSDILNLQKTMTSPIPGQFNETLQYLGVQTNIAGKGMRSVSDVLGDLSEKLSKMNSRTALQWGSKLGLSQDTIRLLQQGREGIAKLKLQAEQLGGIIPNEALRSSIKFNQGLKDIWFSIKGISTQIGLSFLPAIGKVIDKFREWLTVNRELIKSRLSDVMDGISAGFERAWGVIKKIKDAVVEYGSKLFDSIGFTMSLKDATEGFITGALIGLAALAVAWLAIHWPIAAIAAACVALGIGIDDLVAYFSGGQSVIGDFFKSFEEHFPALYDFFGWLKDMFGTGLIAGIKIFTAQVKAAFQFWVDYLKIIYGAIEWVLKKIGFGSDKSKELRKKYKSTANEGIDFAVDGIDMIAATRHNVMNKMVIGNKGGGTVNNNQKVNNVINVQGASNPQQTAGLIFEHLNNNSFNAGQFVPVAQ